MPSHQGPTTKVRDLVTTTRRGRLRNVITEYAPYPDGTWPDSSQSSVPQVRKGKQVTVSEGHPFHSRKGRSGDVGGEFFSQKQFVLADSSVCTLQHVEDRAPYYRETYLFDGPLLAVNPADASYAFPPSAASSNSVLDAWGAKAIAICKPTNSVADVSTFLGELLKDGLPRLLGVSTWENRTKAAKAAGSEFLNTQFGWVPLVSDVRNFAAAVKTADTVLAQYERDAGKMVRRKYHFPSEKEVQTTTIATGKTPFCGAAATWMFSPPYGDLVRTRETVRSRWFSGAFTYHLPTGYDSRMGLTSAALKADKLFGITPTPEVLWNIAPWSWAIDWVTNAGDVISNLTDWALHGLVMRYGYMMEHSIVTDTYTLSEPGLIDKGYRVAPVTFVTETKIRRKANPFGFGLTWDGLSPIQKAIAVALGLSRSR